MLYIIVRDQSHNNTCIATYKGLDIIADVGDIIDVGCSYNRVIRRVFDYTNPSETKVTLFVTREPR